MITDNTDIAPQNLNVYFQPIVAGHLPIESSRPRVRQHLIGLAKTSRFTPEVTLLRPTNQSIGITKTFRLSVLISVQKVNIVGDAIPI